MATSDASHAKGTGFPREIELAHHYKHPPCRICGEPATHLIDVSTLSAMIAPDPYEPRCQAHRPSSMRANEV